MKYETRRERLKSAPYLRLKKRKTFFWKKLKFLKFFSFKKSRIVPKNVKVGTLLDLLTYIPLQNIKKLEGGTLWGQKKSKKSCTVPKKTQRGDPIVSSSFVSYDKNGVTERGGTLCTVLIVLPVCRSSSLVISSWTLILTFVASSLS